MGRLTGANGEPKTCRHEWHELSLILQKETKATKKGQMAESWQDRIMNLNVRTPAQASKTFRDSSTDAHGFYIRKQRSDGAHCPFPYGVFAFHTFDELARNLACAKSAAGSRSAERRTAAFRDRDDKRNVKSSKQKGIL